jgi:nitrogen fixation/metabolism regulation signal transduction histidine kinase
MTRIRARMVVAFAFVVLLPAIPLTLLVRGLLDRSFSGPFLEEVESALDGSVAESRERLREDKARLEAWARDAVAEAASTGGRATARHLQPGDVTFAVPGETPPGVEEVARWAASRLATGGDVAAGPERVGSHLAVCVRDPARGVLLVAAHPLRGATVERAENAAETLALVRQLRKDRAAAVRGYVLPFVATYLVLLAAATAVGAYLARRIARPVEAEIARLARTAAWRDFARSLAHEIKNPLTPIQLAVQELRDKLPEDADAKYAALLRECVDIVNEEVDSLRKLVREFSEFAKLPEPKLDEGDVAALLDDVARLYGGRVSAEVAARPLPARFDPEELRRALVNLVDNGLAACAAAGKNESVTLTGAAADGAVRIDVADGGAGVAPGALARIFEPGFSTKAGSMGLGLAIVDGIVRGHGGTIDVASTPGHGTTFTIRIPRGGSR